MVGVSKPIDGAIEEVILHFNQLTGRYMENKSIHETQKHKWIEESTFEVRIKVYLNYELERLVLSYDENANVIGPENLKKNILFRKKMCKQLLGKCHFFINPVSAILPSN